MPNLIHLAEAGSTMLKGTRPRDRRSLAAEAAFRARVEELGGIVLEPTWLGSLQKHHIRCPAGHDAYVKPAQVQQGGGICWECSGRYPGTAEPAFRARVTVQGGECLYDEWLGNNKRHHIRCEVGHDAYPYPSEVQQGGRICRTCSGKDPVAAEAAFRTAVEATGGTCLYETWRGANEPHHIRCANGHDSYPTPGHVRERGRVPCRFCSEKHPEITEAKFRARLAELGATPLFSEWRGVLASYEVRCAAGHLCRPQAHGVIDGRGICRTCAGQDPAVAEARFLIRLEELGATPLYEQYRGTGRPLHVRCAAGHDCWPRPAGVLAGHGICLICAGQEHSVFYVVEDEGRVVVKFGISSQDGRARLATHRRAGYTRVHLLASGLPEGSARATEDAVKAALRLAGYRSVQGREYYDAAHLALILDVACSWLGDAAA